ncbi:adenylate/guanylate cyclase domain-containing protein [bacterium SCSIO 12741]|nr:adenylate/guanylate cyclase domain-containing protein [bacterium SCSIO 12741]
MRYSKRRRVQYAGIILYWILSINLFSYISIGSIGSFISLADLSLEDMDPVAAYWVSPFQYVESTLFGLLFSILFIWANRWLFRRWKLDRYGFGMSLLISSGVYLVGFLIIVALIYMIIGNLGYYQNFDFFSLTLNPRILGLVSVVMLVLVFQIFMLNFVLKSMEIMGDYNLLRFLTGKYRVPHPEYRAFMFLDLRSSTRHAERLGALLYSEMIRDCFRDLNFLLTEYEAEVYQYVGDEVVLTWPANMAKDDQYMFAFFFAFQDVLKKRSKHYQQKYGQVPEFKAGCNTGLITASEIGVYKRDIAFHGDVINTASRVQGMCNSLGADLLTTEILVNETGRFTFTPMGEHHLRGKEEAIALYAVSRPTD